MNDEQIVEMYLQRDEAAIGHTQTKYGVRLRAVSRGITNDPCAAEEVENDTYLKAWESIPPNKPYNAFFAYLAKITRNLSLSVVRSKSALKRNAVVVELSKELEQCVPDKAHVEEEFDSKLLSEKISAFLDTKTARNRDIFMRRYWFCDSADAIAERFGMSANNVNVMLHRMRNELREYLEKEGYSV